MEVRTMAEVSRAETVRMLDEVPLFCGLAARLRQIDQRADFIG